MEHRNSRVHAARIVQEFRLGLSEETQGQIGELGFGTLEMMIESALTTQVGFVAEGVAKELEGMITRLRAEASSS